MRISGLVRSFQHAWRGVRLCLRTERSFRIQVVLGSLATTAALVLPLTAGERLAVLVVVLIVLVLELVNSSVERLVDALRPRLQDDARDIKDLMAGAVFVASCISLFIGVLVFFPYLLASLARV